MPPIIERLALPVCLDRALIPEEEHEAARFIETNLDHLYRAIIEFRQTFELYLFAHAEKLRGVSPELMISWMHIAGRNGAIVTHGFWIAMQEINSAKAPSIHSKVDMQERDKATKLFSDEFPAISSVRKSAAHPGELTRNAKETLEHGLIGEFVFDDFRIEGGPHHITHVEAYDDTLRFNINFKGKMHSYDLSAHKADVLVSVALHYRRAFAPLEPTTLTAFRGPY